MQAGISWLLSKIFRSKAPCDLPHESPPIPDGVPFEEERSRVSEAAESLRVKLESDRPGHVVLVDPTARPSFHVVQPSQFHLPHAAQVASPHPMPLSALTSGGTVTFLQDKDPRANDVRALDIADEPAALEAWREAQAKLGHSVEAYTYGRASKAALEARIPEDYPNRDQLIEHLLAGRATARKPYIIPPRHLRRLHVFIPVLVEGAAPGDPFYKSRAEELKDAAVRRFQKVYGTCQSRLISDATTEEACRERIAAGGKSGVSGMALADSSLTSLEPSQIGEVHSGTLADHAKRLAAEEAAKPIDPDAPTVILPTPNP